MTTINTTNGTEFTIDTVTPEITLGDIMVSADKRGKELTEAQRIRRVVIPAAHWAGLSATQHLRPSNLLTDILIKGLQGIAKARLVDYLNEQPLARTVSASDYTVEALLAWNQETSKQGDALAYDADEIAEWFTTSNLYTKAAKQGQVVVDVIKGTLTKLAAKNHGIKDEEETTKIIVWLADDEANPVAAALISRLGKISETIAAKKAAPPKVSIANITL
jgi:hypothetical protein